jgi:hypothetical protein
MPFPTPEEVGYYPGNIAGQQALQGSVQPPQYILDAIGGSYDQSKYAWDQERMALVDRTTGSTYGYGHIPDPSLGTDVVTNLSNYNASGRPADYLTPDGSGNFGFPEGVNPYIAFPGESYNAGLVPNSGLFLSADPAEIAEYGSSARDRNWQGIGKIGALVGGAAALGGTAWGQGAAGGGSGTATVSGTTAGPSVAGAYMPGGAAYSPGVIGGTVAPNLGTGVAASGVAAGVPNALTGAGAGPPTSTAGGPGGLIGQGGQDMTAALGSGGGWFDRFLPYISSGASALLNYAGADRAADAEQAGLQAAIDEQRRQYDTTRSDLMPWLTAGTGALGNLQNAGTAFQASPGYDWRRNEGQRDIGNSFAARGGAASGNALRALSEFNQGLAGGEFNNWWNQQAGLAGVGQNTAVNLGNQGQYAANNIGSGRANQGYSRSSGIINRYGSLGQGLTDSLNWLQRRRYGG